MSIIQSGQAISRISYGEYNRISQMLEGIRQIGFGPLIISQVEFPEVTPGIFLEKIDGIIQAEAL